MRRLSRISECTGRPIRGFTTAVSSSAIATSARYASGTTAHSESNAGLFASALEPEAARGVRNAVPLVGDPGCRERIVVVLARNVRRRFRQAERTRHCPGYVQEQSQPPKRLDAAILEEEEVDLLVLSR